MRCRAVALVMVVGLVACACGGTSLNGSEDDPDGGDSGVPTGSGEALYEANCAACHGEGGIGIEGVGKPLVKSEFVADLSDAELVDFLIVGRDTADPLNTTGILKPPRGGNPSLTDEDLAVIVEYVRSLSR